MGTSRVVLAALFVAPLMLFTSLPAASAADSDADGASAAPLVVKVVPVAGKKWLKVKRGLYVVKVSCSNDCAASVRFTLRMARNKVKAGGTRQLGAGDTWITGIQLSKKNFRYLKKNFRRSALKAVVSAVDSGTGQRVVKTRYFRFYR